MGLSWSKYLHDDDFLGEDDEAPWEGAAKLIEYKKGEDPSMEEDDSYKKGEVANKDGGHHKRSNDTSLAVRGETETEFDYGIALYCVDCGTQGDFTFGGRLRGGVLDGVEEASLYLEGNMQAGVNFGLNAYVKYKKSWSSKQKDLDLYKFGVFGIATISPYLGIKLTAEFGIEASGELLLGATAHWDRISFQLDLANSDNSHATGLVPRFEKRAEAKGELEISVVVGLPIELGIKIEIGVDLGLIDLEWEAAVSLILPIHIICDQKEDELMRSRRLAFEIPLPSTSKASLRCLLSSCPKEDLNIM